MARRHLAIFVKGVAEKILSGKKTVEIRLSQNKILPYSAILKDDEIFLKNSGGKIIGRVYVDNCLYYDKIDPRFLEKLKEQYQETAGMDEEFWQKHANARFVTIIFLKNPKEFLTPVVYKKKDRRGWVVLGDKNG